MKIVYVIGWPLGQGGHINSTYNLMKQIIKRHPERKIILIAPRGEKSIYFRALGVDLFDFKYHKNRFIFSLSMILRLFYVCATNRINIFHVMDYKALVHVVFANLFLWKKIIFTKAGGKPLKSKLPKLGSIIVFSKELRDFYIKNKNVHEQEKIFLIKERIDTSIENIKDYKGNSKKLIIFIAMRLENAKKQMLDNLFDELKKINSGSKKLKLVIAGEGKLFNYCLNKSLEIKKKLKDKVEFEFLGEVNDMSKIIDHTLKSNIVVGHGRGILEAMVLQKPVVLLAFDKKGSQLVTSSNVKNISDYNFSGRNFIFKYNDKSLSDILNDKNSKNILEESAKFNKKYILDEYDVLIGAEKTLNVYNKTNLYDFKTFENNFLWMFNKLDFNFKSSRLK